MDLSPEILILSITIAGSFITIALTVNAFFLRGIFKDLNDVKIALAEITTSANDRNNRIHNLEVNEKELFIRLNKLEREAKA